MSPEELVLAFKSAITDLQQLHVLAQTETLMLDETDFDELDQVIRSKENLVARIVEFHALISGSPADASAPPGRELQELGRQAADLVAKVTQVEGRNRIRLERLRSGAIQALQALHHERQLSRAYR